VIDKVRVCIADALKLDASLASLITEDTTAADLSGWTSIAHLSLILQLETTFGVRFGNDEIASLGSVAAILEALAQKGADPASD